MKGKFSYTACLVLLSVLIAGCKPALEKPAVPVQSASVQSEQFGARRIDFTIGEKGGFIILPTKDSADGSKPWVWYAPTLIGQYPNDSHRWMFEQLLAEGFSICGVDVGESYGSPAGRQIYSDFHQLVTSKYGLDSKSCLFAQSRGGLMLYNWAAENPQRVQCIVGLYSVCNLESYPGLASACGAYGMTEDELRKDLAEHNPIDRLSGLANAAVPILHIHGDSDVVVPLEENSGELVRRYRASGGKADVIIVAGKGHEVCPQFFQCQKLVDFLLAQGNVLSQFN